MWGPSIIGFGTTTYTNTTGTNEWFVSVPDWLPRPRRGHHPHVKMARWSERSVGRSICVISVVACIPTLAAGHVSLRFERI
jgi:hypothetical protein